MKKHFLKNQNGQGILEYIMLTGLIGIFCLIAVKQIGSSMKSRLDKINKNITKHIEIR